MPPHNDNHASHSFWDEDPAPADNSRVWQVGALCRAVHDALSARFATMRVKGEITSWVRAGSGHCYFSLKDSDGQMRCAMFSRYAQQLNWQPKNGDKVEIKARLGVYAERGDLQLIVESLQRAGLGELYEAFLKIKADLAAQGLFDAERKRPLTAFPRGLGLVTSLEAAALQDVSTTLQRRAPHVPVYLAPAAVQGAQAPAALIKALQHLYQLCRSTDTNTQTSAASPKRPIIDTILLVRGGGSLEDLWAFNSPQLAHTIAQSPVPVIVGVGHETDFTIADLCADVRAPTPTAAAELAATPLQTAWLQQQTWGRRLLERTHRLLDAHGQRLDRLTWSLSKGAQSVKDQSTHLRHLESRLQHSRTTTPKDHRQRLQNLHARLLQAGLRQSNQGQALRMQSAEHALHSRTQQCLQQHRSQLQSLYQRWQQALQAHLALQENKLQRQENSLRLLNPQQVLERGFALLQDDSGKVLTRKADFTQGKTVRATVQDGQVILQRP